MAYELIASDSTVNYNINRAFMPKRKIVWFCHSSIVTVSISIHWEKFRSSNTRGAECTSFNFNWQTYTEQSMNITSWKGAHVHRSMCHKTRKKNIWQSINWMKWIYEERIKKYKQKFFLRQQPVQLRTMTMTRTVQKQIQTEHKWYIA